MPRTNGKTNPPVPETNRRPPAPTERTVTKRYSTHSASYDECDNQVLRDAVVSVTNAGAAILFGRTSDGGAFSIQVYDGQERIREWPHSTEELESVLKWLRDMYSTD